jgi:hypothetical protein
MGLELGYVMTTHYQDQGFQGVKNQSATKALNAANAELAQARNHTPSDEIPNYRSIIRWEGDGYAWYWILK